MKDAMRCRRATRLLSDRLDGPLPAGPRLWLAGHLLMCEPCREAERQLAFLHLAFGRMDEIVAREGLPFDPPA
jgi:predicted anti-sigma-YlaC factor YlaD